MPYLPNSMPFWPTGLLVCAVLLTSCGSPPDGDPADADTHGSSALQLHVLSAKPHLVSGGDVLVRVDVTDGTPLDEVAVSVNGSDVTAAFREEAGRRALLGLVTGLQDGHNLLESYVREGSETVASLDLTNYPITGPMISGPHQEPFYCRTADFELVTGEVLGAPIDEHCSVETRVDYVFRSTDGTFKPLADLDGPRPADLARTTTMDGHAVPFIVRVETGTINRGIYESAILHDPSEPEPDPWMRSTGWNGTLVYTHGGGCQGGWYHQGIETGGVLHAGLLEDGYAVTSSTLNRFGQNCNDLLASETHLMVKERFVERYGEPDFTISTGSSGGSYQSHQTADNYPGVFDGIIVGASFPDVTSATLYTLADARLLLHYFTEIAPGLFTEEEQRLVSGFGQWGQLPHLSMRAARIDPIFDPEAPPEQLGGEFGLAGYYGGGDGGVPQALVDERYHPATNPSGVRATVYDHTVNVYGIDPESGFAARPLDNVGVQYGLGALNAGQITIAQFLDLNERIGGFDADANHVPERHVADMHAARMAIETGRILYGGAGLATTPIIDYRTYGDDDPEGDIHMKVHQFSTRARLVAANGHADNQVMVVGGRWGFTDDAPDLRTLFHEMDTWLTNLANDTSNTPAAEKVVRAKPPGLADACWDNRSEPRRKVEEPQTYDGSGLCNELYPSFPTPRHVAGAPLANDLVKCQLKPIDPDDYTVAFTPDERQRLGGIFPDGVCDWTKPGAEQTAHAGTWLSLGPSAVNRVR